MPSTSRNTARIPQPSQRELSELAQAFGEGPGGAARDLAERFARRYAQHGFGWKVLGAVLLQQAEYTASAAASRRAVALLPDDASTYNNLGTALLGLEQLDEAAAQLHAALEIAPDYAKAHFNLSKVCRLQGKREQAEAHCRNAVDSDPSYAAAHFSLGNLLELQNRIPEAVASYRRALALEPGNAVMFSDMLHLMSHDVHTDAVDNLEAHRQFGAQFEPALRSHWGGYANTKVADRRLKIGFVSSDAYDHALANYLEPLFRLLNRKPGLEVHLYYTNTKDDAVTGRMRSYFRHWHDVAALDAAQLAQQIRSDTIDILVDVNGHTVLNRLQTFARKPAPIQMGWLGYLGTSGLQAMDYHIGDPYWIPPDQLDWQFMEKLAYLPAAVVFEPNASAPQVNALPALGNRHITFGSFNRHNKINDAVIALWSLLMNQVPDSRLKMGGIAPEHRADLQSRFAAQGVAAERLSFFARTIQTEYLALHHEVDFCLDTFPFCGGATSAHAAWMGVPTLTLAGELPASRLGAAEMHHLGLDAFVAESIEDFMEKGLYWATHTAELAVLRAGLRERFSQSRLGQTVAFANHFEAMLRSVWQRWCQDLPTESFMVDASAVAVAPLRATEPSDETLEHLLNLHARQEHDQVEALARQLTHDFPEHGAGWKYLGGALRQLGRVEEALDVQRETTRRRPKDYEAHFNLAAELQQQGLFDEAVRSYLQALSLQPNNPMAYNNLSNIFKLMGLFPQAEQYCRQALELKPDMVIAQNNLGNALHAQGKYAEAETYYRQALEGKPNWAEAYNNLAICLKDQGYGSEAKEAYRKALSLKEDWAAARSNLLFSLSLDVQTPPEELHAEHLLYGQLFEPKLLDQRRPYGNDKSPERTLHIGFVSGDMYDHALTNFLEPLFKGLSARAELVLHAYYTHIYEDAATRRLCGHFHAWNKVVDLSDEALAEKIRADRIDILIDLSGHTAHNRLLTFARKPAPVQASYLGYLGSTGLQSMDYFLCDEFWVPPGQLDWQFTEKMAYLPAAVVFEASPHAAEVNPLPALQNGYITFGSFNRPNKLNPSVIALWSMLLQAVPTARMVLGGIAAERQEELFRRFMENGVDINRLTFFPRANIQEYLALHHQVDFCLDTFPYGGGATNANAAWMGVPTLCLAGESPASRFGPTSMHILGLEGFIAESIDDFIARGVHWAQHIPELAELRAGLRQRFMASPMGQPQAFADDFAALLRAMWQRWCGDLPPATLGLGAATAAATPPDNLPAAPPETQKVAEEPPTAIETLLAQERFEEAVQPLQQAIAASPTDACLHNNLGVVLMSLQRLAEAEDALRTAMALQPGYSKAMVNLATVLRLQGRSEEAESVCRSALASDPSDSAAWIQLGNALEAQGKSSAAQACYYKADMAHEPRRAVAHSNVLYLLNHDVLVEPADLIAEHMAFGEMFEAPLRDQWPAHSNSKEPLRRLKIGFVSGDFCGHALTHFLEPAFKALSTRPLLELHAYATRLEEDEVTQRLRWYFDQWSQVAELSNEALAARIRADGIDILIDLSGHTARNRLLTFSLKPAPVQVGWIGYLGTSGLQAMDYALCDAHWLPQDLHAWQFTEQLAYLPSSVVFAPDALAPPVNALPALANGYVTFGSFNRVSKVNDGVIALWSLLMQRVPTSRILLGGITDGNRHAIEETFAAHGIAAERIRFVPRLGMADYLQHHHLVDLCLDTFPHGGGATTAHAAWMGVPTLCLVGETPASRFGASLLLQLGLSALVATGIDDFVETGVRLANDLAQLQQIRAVLRSRFVASSLGQPQQFALHLEASLRAMWSTWCADRPAASLDIQNVPQTTDQPPADTTCIRLVSATKLSEADFWQHSALGQSLQPHMAIDARLSVSVAFENRQGLPDIFNRAIAQAQAGEVLVFIHDDVWLDEPFLADTLLAGLAQFDVIGVAGNRRRCPRQAAWPFADARFIWDEKSNLSGRVGHGKNAHGQVCAYGPTPAACLLLDGMFMAARSSTLQASGVRFDSQFDFHFYDLDLCRTASEADLHLGTWPVALTHQSAGAYGSQGWRDKYQLYLDKWNDPEPERPASVIRQVCIGHRAFELPIPAHVPVIWLGTAKVETQGQHVVHALNSISPELDTWHSLLGGSAGTFATYLMLRSKLIDWSPEDRISILQYRKFMARRPMGTEARNYPGLYLVARGDAAALDLDAIHAEVTTPYLLPQPLALGNLYAQYATCHRGTDLLRYTAIATELNVITEQETLAFFNTTHMIPGGIEFGIYPIPVFLEIMEKVSAVAMAFLQQHRPVCLDAEQRRAVSFCNERLGSYLLIKRLEQDYQHTIPTDIFGYMHNVVDGQVYQASPGHSCA
jgi:predicted O-linked N-acetylglucosamine transferase (SPINDLY family)